METFNIEFPGPFRSLRWKLFEVIPTFRNEVSLSWDSDLLVTKFRHIIALELAGNITAVVTALQPHSEVTTLQPTTISYSE